MLVCVEFRLSCQSNTETKAGKKTQDAPTNVTPRIAIECSASLLGDVAVGTVGYCTPDSDIFSNAAFAGASCGFISASGSTPLCLENQNSTRNKEVENFSSKIQLLQPLFVTISESLLKCATKNSHALVIRAIDCLNLCSGIGEDEINCNV